VTYQSIGNFVQINKTYTLRGQKDENKPSKPKNGIWSRKKYIFGGQKGENKLSEP
jgi:hypothetical protein